MIGIFDSSVVMLETQPRDPSMVVLQEFPIGFEALVIVHYKIGGLFFQSEHSIQERWIAIEGLAIGSTLGLHLEDT
jgi:hypothetical protein